jgi:hypothetical protein
MSLIYARLIVMMMVLVTRVTIALMSPTMIKQIPMGMGLEISVMRLIHPLLLNSHGMMTQSTLIYISLTQEVDSLVAAMTVGRLIYLQSGLRQVSRATLQTMVRPVK